MMVHDDAYHRIIVPLNAWMKEYYPYDKALVDSDPNAPVKTLLINIAYHQIIFLGPVAGVAKAKETLTAAGIMNSEDVLSLNNRGELLIGTQTLRDTWGYGRLRIHPDCKLIAVTYLPKLGVEELGMLDEKGGQRLWVGSKITAGFREMFAIGNPDSFQRQDQIDIGGEKQMAIFFKTGEVYVLGNEGWINRGLHPGGFSVTDVIMTTLGVWKIVFSDKDIADLSYSFSLWAYIFDKPEDRRIIFGNAVSNLIRRGKLPEGIYDYQSASLSALIGAIREIEKIQGTRSGAFDYPYIRPLAKVR